MCATHVGADWVIVELTETDAIPYRCWMLDDISIVSEDSSDGIYWENPEGELVHISGSYDYVQVDSKDWASALAQVNMDIPTCLSINQSKYDLAESRYVYPKVKATPHAVSGKYKAEVIHPDIIKFENKKKAAKEQEAWEKAEKRAAEAARLAEQAPGLH